MSGTSINPGCALVLRILADEDTTGGFRLRLNRKDKEQLLHQIDRNDQKISLEEMKAFADEKAKAKLPSTVQGIFNITLIEDAWELFDEDRTGTLDVEEFKNFLDGLEAARIRFLLKKSYMLWRAYYACQNTWFSSQHIEELTVTPKDLVRAAGATAQPSNGEDPYTALIAPVEQKEGMMPKKWPIFQCGRDPDCKGSTIIPPDWIHDFYYYSANNHPLHGIFCCDNEHPLEKKERLCMEIATWGFSFYTVMLKTAWVNQGNAPIPMLENKVMFSLVVVTVPSMVMFWVLFLLFTCPCYVVDESTNDAASVKKARRCMRIGAVVAYTLCAIGILFFLVRLVFSKVAQHHHMHLKSVIISRLSSYVIAWLMMLLIYMNPLLAWGQTDPDGTPSSLADLIGLGQWRIEKQRFQALSLKAAPHTEDPELAKSKTGGCWGRW